MDLTDDEAPRIFGDHDSFIVVDDETWMMDWEFVPSIFVVAHNYGVFLRNVLNPKQTMGGRNQDAAYSEASPCQTNKVWTKIPLWVFLFLCLEHLTTFSFGGCI